MATRFVKLTDPAVAVGAAEAIPHGLGAVPDVYFLTNDCGVNCTESATPPDAVNIYINNGGAGVELVNAVAILQ